MDIVLQGTLGLLGGFFFFWALGTWGALVVTGGVGKRMKCYKAAPCDPPQPRTSGAIHNGVWGAFLTAVLNSDVPAWQILYAVDYDATVR